MLSSTIKVLNVHVLDDDVVPSKAFTFSNPGNELKHIWQILVLQKQRQRLEGVGGIGSTTMPKTKGYSRSSGERRKSRPFLSWKQTILLTGVLLTFQINLTGERDSHLITPQTAFQDYRLMLQTKYYSLTRAPFPGNFPKFYPSKYYSKSSLLNCGFLVC